MGNMGNNNTYSVFKNSVTVHVNGVTSTISKDDQRHAKLIEIIGKNRLEEMEGVINNPKFIREIETLLGI